jgi:carboxypeptidase family protein
MPLPDPSRLSPLTSIGPLNFLSVPRRVDYSPAATRRPRCLCTVFLLVLTPTSVSAQSISGRVIDLVSQQGIPTAVVDISGEGGAQYRVLTDSVGVFAIRLPDGGDYWIRASALGFIRSASSSVRVENVRQLVEVVITMSAQAVQLEGLEVVARGMELRHRASFEGFLVRRDETLSVGPSRVVSREDPESRPASNVEDVLRWFPDPAGCTVVYMDGMAQSGWSDVGRIAALSVAGDDQGTRDKHAVLTPARHWIPPPTVPR